ncbi:MAG: hypothetical protein LBJ31_04595 [Treponema sp.]|jgi:hypothetical protein|nr:hypothetical protein [Treponema sp.]
MKGKDNVISQFNENCLLIKIRQKTIDERGSTYEAVRQYWAADQKRAEYTDLVLAVLAGSGGKVIGVYKPLEWHNVTAEYVKYQEKHNRPFSSRERIAFTGCEADDAAKKRYLDKYLPDELWKAQAPFRYRYKQ